MNEKRPIEQYIALALATLAFTLCFAIWGLLAPLVPQFREQFDLTGTETGVLVAIPVLLGSLARIPFGILTDRFGGKLVFSGLLAFLLLPLALSFLATSYAGLLVLGFWLGLAGSSFAIGIPYVSRFFRAEQQGLALGIYGMGNVGTAVAAFVAPRVADSATWYYAFWLFVIPLLALILLFWALAPREPSRAPRPASLMEDLRKLGTEPLAWILSLFYFITFGGFVASSIFLPTLLVDLYQVDRADAGLVAAILVVAATLSRPVGGWVSDHAGGAAVLLGVLMVTALLAIVLAAQPGLGIMIVVFVVLGAVLGLGNGAVFKLVPQYFPAHTGSITGLVGAAGGLGGFFPPILLGYVRDATGSYSIGFQLLALFAVACLILDFLIFFHRSPRTAR